MNTPKNSVLKELQVWLEEMTGTAFNLYHYAEEASETGGTLPHIPEDLPTYWENVYNQVAIAQERSIEAEIRTNLFDLKEENRAVIYLTDVNDFIGILNDAIFSLEGPKGIITLAYYKQKEASDLSLRFFKLCSAFRQVKEQIIALVNKSYLVKKHSDLLPNLSTTSTVINQDPEIAFGTLSKKTRKKENISLKQQMILLDMLGFLKADVWGSAGKKDKAFILSQLLNRSEQEVRGMLTYWEGSKPPLVYDCTRADDNDAVTDMVFGKGLTV